VSFNGAACCVGEKTITCTVSNSMGSAKKSIVIAILEVINIPEIISLESDKTTIHSGAGETASLVCYAIGGHLTYAWQSDCGTLAVDAKDSSKATMTATTECTGSRIVTCTVSNEKGKDVKTLQLIVAK
jgi:PKD repeat protein